MSDVTPLFIVMESHYRSHRWRQRAMNQPLCYEIKIELPTLAPTSQLWGGLHSSGGGGGHLWAGGSSPPSTEPLCGRSTRDAWGTAAALFSSAKPQAEAMLPWWGV